MSICTSTDYFESLTDDQLSQKIQIYQKRISPSVPEFIREFWTQKIEEVRQISAARKEGAAAL